MTSEYPQLPEVFVDNVTSRERMLIVGDDRPIIVPANLKPTAGDVMNLRSALVSVTELAPDEDRDYYGHVIIGRADDLKTVVSPSGILGIKVSRDEVITGFMGTRRTEVKTSDGVVVVADQDSPIGFKAVLERSGTVRRVHKHGSLKNVKLHLPATQQDVQLAVGLLAIARTKLLQDFCPEQVDN